MQSVVYLSRLKLMLQPLLKQPVICLTVIFLALSSRTASVSAEEYVFESGHNNNVYNAQVISHPEIRKYLYGILGAGHDAADYYEFTFAGYTQQVVFELLLPDGGTKNLFHPSLAFLDPTSGQLTGGGNLPFGFPANMGGRIFPWPKTQERVVTDEDVWMKLRLGPQFVKDVSPTRYMIAVYDPDGAGGRYVLHLGAGATDDASIFSLFNRLPAFFRIKLGIY